MAVHHVGPVLVGSRRRTAAALALVVLATCLATGLFVPAATASCAGPHLAIGIDGGVPAQPSSSEGGTAPTAVRAGDRLQVQGLFFVDGCPDTYSCTAGCGSCGPTETPDPMRLVELTLVAGGVRTSLGTHDAADDGSMSWEGVVPSDVSPGAATLEAEPAGAVEPVAALPLQVLAG